MKNNEIMWEQAIVMANATPKSHDILTDIMAAYDDCIMTAWQAWKSQSHLLPTNPQSHCIKNRGNHARNALDHDQTVNQHIHEFLGRERNITCS